MPAPFRLARCTFLLNSAPGRLPGALFWQVVAALTRAWMWATAPQTLAPTDNKPTYADDCEKPYRNHSARAVTGSLGACRLDRQ
jgi:hypothetical protein